MKRSTAALIILVLLIAALGIGYYYDQKMKNKPLNEQLQQDNTTYADEAQVRRTVDDFGLKLKNVSLMGPTASGDMDANYKDLVEPSLLTSWKSDPTKAPGRLTSSPWPDRIDVGNITKLSNDSYRVEGKIVEVTSADQTAGNEAGMRDITLTVDRSDGKWLIADVNMAPAPSGSTQGPGQAGMKSATTNGITFDYPEKLSSTYIATQSWPPALKANTGTYFCNQTGEEQTSNGQTVTQKVLNGRIYCITTKNEGAAGSTYTTYTYNTPKNGRILNVSFTLRYPQCSNYPAQQNTACTTDRTNFDPDSVVDGIVQSAKWDISQDNSDAVKLQECLPKSDQGSKAACDAIMNKVGNFNACVIDGFPVTAGTPPTCTMPNGKSFKQS